VDASQVYTVISVAILGAIAILVLFVAPKKPGERLSRLAVLAFGCIVAGILFGENQIVGYGLIGIGIMIYRPWRAGFGYHQEGFFHFFR
jgi:hypothetical protein